MSPRRLLPLVVIGVVFATSAPASASAVFPDPVVSAGHSKVTLGQARMSCWRASAPEEQPRTVVCSEFVGTKAPDGRLKVGRDRIVHIDMGQAATWVRVGRFRATRLDTSGRYWSVRVGRFQKQVHLLAGIKDQVEGSYLFGPLVLVP